jgi:hypothetical protein
MTIALPTGSCSRSLSAQEAQQQSAAQLQGPPSPEFQRLEEKSRERIQAMSPVRFHLMQLGWRAVGALARTVARL